jgi:ABC-2 type transport system permease protein
MFPYLKLLVRQRLAALNPVSWRRAGRSKARAVASFIGFALLALMLYAMLVVMEYFLYETFTQLGEPETMLALSGLFCTVLVVITSFFYVLNELFFSKDIAFVSALPISSRSLLTAKLLRVWLGEATIALLICLPSVVLYGVGNGLGVTFYLKTLLLVPLLPMAPLCVVTLMSFLLIRISVLWKRREALTVVMSMAFLIAFMYFEMRFSFAMNDKENAGAIFLQMISQQRHILDSLLNVYPPIHWFSGAYTLSGGASAINLLLFIALNAGALTLTIAALGGVYQKLAVRQSDVFSRMNAKIKIRADRHGMRSPLRALYRREMREIFSVPIYAMNSFASAVMMPVIAVAMLMSGNFDGVAVSMFPVMLLLVPRPLIIAVAAAVFAFTGSMNMAVSTAVSREGKRHEFFRTLPVKPQSQMLAKFLMGLTVNLICALPIAVILIAVFPQMAVEIIAGFLIGEAVSVATSLFALMVDAAHPKFNWRSETEAIKQNSLAALSMFAAMAFIVVCGGVYFGLTVLGMSLMGALLSLSATLVALDLLLARRMLGKASRTYILQELHN